MAAIDDYKSGTANPGPFIVSQPCPVCDGQGTVDEQPCPACHGTGVQRFFHGTKTDLKPGDLIEPGYRTREPLRVTGEITEWEGHPSDVLKAMKDRVEEMKQLGVEAIDD